MSLIDTHSHIYLPQFDEDLDAMIARAREAGVTKIFLPNIDLDSIPLMHKLSDRYPELCYPMLGLHPCDVKENYIDVLNTMKPMFNDRKYIAVGEIGIDLYWDKTTLDIQIEAFKIQCAWAKALALPIVIHARDSFDEIFAVMDEIHDDKLFGVFHCFTGHADQAKKVMSYGNFLMGIGGVLTYEKSGLDVVAKDIPMEYLVLETDSPFLTPKPFRGKRNESSYVKFVAEKLATVKELSYDEVIGTTSQNALKIFRP
ncbi:MAG: TatD family hydrolase [Flavobacteriales bacterium]|nr:TatD family hydrolase [Flavobacteriales bacterium]